MTGTLGHLGLAAAVFVASHGGLSGGAVRGWLVARLGRPAFLTLYSVVALAALGWFIAAYAAAPYAELWPAAPWTRLVPLVVMPFSAILLVAGLSTANATVTADGKLPEGADPAPGILKVTRHPVMWAIALWAAAHVPPNGDVAALVLLGTFLALALTGMARLDAKRARGQQQAWRRFAAVTSALPFAATAQGRNRVSLADIGWGRIVGGLALYGVFLFGHEWVIGKSALPF